LLPARPRRGACPARSFALRAATSLARLWQQGKRAEAYQLLVEVYGWCTEGFGTADLQEARALLEELTEYQVGMRKTCRKHKEEL
jgi:predicted ATPase